VAHRLAELAELVSGRVEGDPDRTVEAIRALEAAGPGDLSFVTLARHRARALASGAGALLVGENLAAALAGDRQGPGADLLVVADPGYALARLLALFHPEPARVAGRHPTAIVGEGAVVDPAAHLGPYAVIGAGSRVEAGAAVLAHAVVGSGCTIGERALIYPHAVLYDRTEVGAGCIVHSGVVLGGDGFGYATRGGVHHKVPQVGRVVLEDEVEIGANTTIDRATLGETRVGAGTKIDNQVMLGHNVQVGRRSLLCAKVGIAGSTRIGDGVVLGARVGAVDHVEIGDRVQAAAGTDIFESLPPGAVVGGSPAHPVGRWRRQLVLLWKLEEMFRRLRALERRSPGTSRRDAVSDDDEPNPKQHPGGPEGAPAAGAADSPAAGAADSNNVTTPAADPEAGAVEPPRFTPQGIDWILKMLPHRYPMLLVDRVLEYEPRKRLVAIKNVTINEPFFAGHFPGKPVMPGVLLIEAMAQAGALMLLQQVEERAGKLLFLTGISDAKFRRPVVPGDQVRFEIDVIRIRSGHSRLSCKALVDGHLAAEAVLSSTRVDL
jgi:UDP-3-O-[3-hydroxymyristoyl] glucosamine N-acyltransferase